MILISAYTAESTHSAVYTETKNRRKEKNKLKILKCEEKEGKLISAEVHYNQFTQEHEYNVFVKEKKLESGL